VLAVARGLRRGTAGIGTGVGFGQTPAADFLAPRQGRQETLLLRFVACQEEVAPAQAVVRGERQRDAGVDARDLLHHDRVVERREPRATIFDGPHHAHQTERAELFEHAAGKTLLLVPLPGVRPELTLGKISNGLLE
jgi:hypothetical protein